jgi:hypothetical protein
MFANILSMNQSVPPGFLPLPSEISPQAAKALEEAAMRQGLTAEELAGRIIEASFQSSPLPPSPSAEEEQRGSTQTP